MPDWKDEYRAEKEASGKTWDEFVRTEMHHESDIQSLAGVVADLSEHVEALESEVRDLRHELAERRILDERDNGN